MLHGGRYSESYTEALPDFVKLADAFHGVGLRAKSVDQLDDVIREMIALDRPVIADICVDEKENCDVSQADMVDATIAAAIERFGIIDGLVNNAGISRPAMADRMTLETWQSVVDVNLTGSFLMLQAVGRHMIEQAKAGATGERSIVNIASDAGRRGTIGQINYGATKAGVFGLTMSAAREWARFGIRVNAVSFGVVETPMTETIRQDKCRETYLQQIPLGRFAPSEEVAQPVVFMLSAAASYITGQTLSVNGGFVIGG